jgi:hypothetical protein
VSKYKSERNVDTLYRFSNLSELAVNNATSSLDEYTDLGFKNLLEKLSDYKTLSLIISKAILSFGRYLHIIS